MTHTIIIGSGMAGITCAKALHMAGVPVRVLDKGRTIGGRMATRQQDLGTGHVTFDHGAQYLRPRDPAFAEAIASAGAQDWAATCGSGRFVGVPGMSDVLQRMGKGLDIVQHTEVTHLERREHGWHLAGPAGEFSAKRLVLTIPAPQVAALLGPDHPFTPDVSRVVMDPCLTLMAAFPKDSPRPFAFHLDPSHALSWIAQNNTKPGRSDAAVTWVAQAGHAFSSVNLNADAAHIAARMLPLLADVIGVDPAQAIHARAHRWRYAQASKPLGQPFLHSEDKTLYAGGDWCLGPRAEDAWHSGQAIARDILDHADVV
jgi:predicted NAD/FAD-dependent oxidoreductase